MRAFILAHMQGDMKAGVEKSLQQVGGPDAVEFHQCRDKVKSVLETIRKFDGDGTVVRYPDAVLFDAVQGTFVDWNKYVAGMLPDPVSIRPFTRHPWPTRFALVLTPDPTPCGPRSSQCVYEIDRLLLAKIAGNNKAFGSLLAELSDRLEPAETDFRVTDFEVRDSLRKA